MIKTKSPDLRVTLHTLLIQQNVYIVINTQYSLQLYREETNV